MDRMDGKLDLSTVHSYATIIIISVCFNILRHCEPPSLKTDQHSSVQPYVVHKCKQLSVKRSQAETEIDTLVEQMGFGNSDSTEMQCHIQFFM